jgi:endonuclease III related protein
MRGKGLKGEEIWRTLQTLEAAMGPQHWWPAGSAFEVVAGAYLTQNTAWTNVELAMGNLRRAGVLSISGIRNTALEELEQLVRPAGYFRQKAARLKLFIAHLDANYGGSLDTMFTKPTEALREELLGLPGIGPETADSILLYAANREVFVVDSYTRRIFERHGLVKPETGYEEIRLAVQRALEAKAGRLSDNQRQAQGQQPHLDAASPEARRKDGAPEPVPHEPSAASQMERSELAQRYNEFHALLVQTAKHFCVKGTPKCENCPLREMLEAEQTKGKVNGKKSPASGTNNRE